MKKKASKSKLHFQRYKSLYALIVLEVVMVWFFLAMWTGSRPLSEIKLETATVVVEHTFHSSYKTSTFVVRSGGESYAFPNLTERYSNSELYDTVQRGDRLHLTYYEGRWFFGLAKRNFVVEAHTDEVQLRTVEEYTAGKEGLRIFYVVFFLLGELLYGFGVFAYFRFNKKHFAKLRKERRKRREKEKKKKKSE